MRGEEDAPIIPRGPGSELRSLLLLGSPGVGKTTLLRDVARLLADWGLNVVVVDTSNEIAGECPQQVCIEYPLVSSGTESTRPEAVMTPSYASRLE
jgi:hypothetical protein